MDRELRSFPAAAHVRRPRRPRDRRRRAPDRDAGAKRGHLLAVHDHLADAGQRPLAAGWRPARAWGRRGPAADLGDAPGHAGMGPAAPARPSGRSAGVAAARLGGAVRSSLRILGVAAVALLAPAGELPGGGEGAGRKVPPEPAPAEAPARRAG